jgi:hypothetical protein
MWSSSVARSQLVALRCEAARAMGGREPFDEPVALTLQVRAPDELPERRGQGELYGFITGVCDGLQAARTLVSDDAWQDLPVAAQPGSHIAFTDDSWVRRIVAEVVPGVLGYDVVIERLAS